MEKESEVIDHVEIIFAVEGHPGHHKAKIEPKVTVREFVDIAVTVTGIKELVEVYLEDAEHPLHADLVLLEQLTVEFAPLHVAKPGKIKTKVRYQDRHVEREFRAAATIAAITVWAVGKHGLDLQGDPSDFQLKHDGKVLAPETHLGQVAHGKKEITLELVFKVKPQG